MKPELNVKYQGLWKEHVYLLSLQLRKSWMTSVPLRFELGDSLDFHLPSHILLNSPQYVRMEKANERWLPIRYRSERTFVVSGRRNLEAFLS